MARRKRSVLLAGHDGGGGAEVGHAEGGGEGRIERQDELLIGLAPVLDHRNVHRSLSRHAERLRRRHLSLSLFLRSSARSTNRCKRTAPASNTAQIKNASIKLLNFPLLRKRNKKCKK